MTKKSYKRLSATRAAALQTLYSGAFHEEGAAGALAHALSGDDGLPEMTLKTFYSEFLEELVMGVDTHSADIDIVVAQNLPPDWSFRRLDRVTLALLRLAVFEIVYMQRYDIPLTVSEYVALADTFLTEKGHAFVNGFLRRLPQRAAE